MNLHALTFEQILRLCASLEDPKEIREMLQALDLLEKNIHYQRQGLAGRLKGLERQQKAAEEQRRQALKDSLRLIRPGKEEGEDEDGLP